MNHPCAKGTAGPLEIALDLKENLFEYAYSDKETEGLESKPG